MTDKPTKPGKESTGSRRSLKQAVHIVKNRQAERDDVVVEMKAAEETRLELLADELRPLFEEIDGSDERFQLALTRGDRPRLWIDMTSFVAMGHDRRTYRFSKDTRLGRFVLEESDKIETVADAVTQYIAECVLERERALEGDWVSLKAADANNPDPESNASRQPAEAAPVAQALSVAPDGGLWRSIAAFLFGVLLALVIAGIAAYSLIPGLLSSGS